MKLAKINPKINPKINAHGQTTIPKSIREAANLDACDEIAFEIKGDRLVVHKVTDGKCDYFKGFSRVLSKWCSPQDEKAWRDP